MVAFPAWCVAISDSVLSVFCFVLQNCTVGLHPSVYCSVCRTTTYS